MNKNKSNRNTGSNHSWEKLNRQQSKCIKCGVIKTTITKKGVVNVEYQTNDCVVHKEYVECKPIDYGTITTN